MNRKQSNLNKELAKKQGKENYHGESCRFCLGFIRWTKRNNCVNCYTKNSIPKNFEKRKQQLVSKIKAQAKLKGIEFNLTKQDIDWVKSCPIMDIEINYYTEKFREYNTASFDRKDPNKGYIKGNVFIISNIANMRKSDLTVKQMERMLEYAKS
jgi:hypothetical protein